jgi:tetratricopeptide (TPR) repeat protein
LRGAANSSPPDEVKIATYIAFLLDQKRNTDAEAYIDRLISLAPKSRSTYILRVLLQSSKVGKPAEGIIDEWMESLTGKYENSKDFSTYENMDLMFAGAMFEVATDEVRADQVVENLIERKTESAREYLLYLLRHEVGQLRNAAMKRIVKHFDELQFTPQDIMSTLLISLSLPFEKSSVEAYKETLNKVMENSKTFDPVLARLVGDFYIMKSDFPAARKAYEALANAEPENIVALNNLANILVEQGPENAPQALEYIDRALKIMPNEAPLLDSKGTILIMMKKYDEAAKALELATAKGGDPRSALHWYVALARGGREAEANKIKSKINVKALRDVHLSAEDKEVLSKLQ